MALGMLLRIEGIAGVVMGNAAMSVAPYDTYHVGLPSGAVSVTIRGYANDMFGDTFNFFFAGHRGFVAHWALQFQRVRARMPHPSWPGESITRVARLWCLDKSTTGSEIEKNGRPKAGPVLFPQLLADVLPDLSFQLTVGTPTCVVPTVTVGTVFGRQPNGS